MVKIKETDSVEVCVHLFIRDWIAVWEWFSTNAKWNELCMNHTMMRRFVEGLNKVGQAQSFESVCRAATAYAS